MVVQKWCFGYRRSMIALKTPANESQILSDRCMDIGRMGAHTYYT